MSKVNINYGGGTIILTALLCMLKLTGVLSISWWWCFCLIWLPFAILGVMVAIAVPFLIVVFIIEILSNR